MKLNVWKMIEKEILGIDKIEIKYYKGNIFVIVKYLSCNFKLSH